MSIRDYIKVCTWLSNESNVQIGNTLFGHRDRFPALYESEHCWIFNVFMITEIERPFNYPVGIYYGYGLGLEYTYCVFEKTLKLRFLAFVTM